MLHEKKGDQTSGEVPKLIRFLALHGAIGGVIGSAVAGLLLMLPGLPIGGLMATTATSVTAAIIYFGSFGFTFASLAMGIAIMMLPKDDTFPD